ncbi:MAG: hypothetical protein GXP48_10935, partial [Acidobacteria bacterium]|nr:hypothetical protein [Acidobacteriota bacterium]
WITPSDAAQQFGLGVVGMWVRVNGTDYRVIAQQDRRTILLEGAAGAVTAGDAFQGVYTFDSVTVKGGARLDIQDIGVIGTTSVDPDSQIITANLAAPAIDAAKVTLSAHDQGFWIEGAAGAVTDADGIASARAVNTTHTGDPVELQVQDDGSFPAVEIPGTSGDAISVQATDGHFHPRTSEASVGALPANTGPPAVDTGAISVTQVASGKWHVVGAAGAVADQELPITVAVADQTAGTSQAVQAGTDGSFAVTISGSAGDPLILTATDGHPEPQSTQVDLGPAPGNKPPVIDSSGLHVSYVGPDPEDPAHYQLTVDAGAITDDDPPINLTVMSPTDESWSGSIQSGGSITLGLYSGQLEPGMVLTLIATDSNAAGSASTTVDLPQLPPDNYGPPVVDVSKIQIRPLGFGYQVVAEAGAVTDPDVPLTVTLTNATSGWSSASVAVRQDGSFWTRIEGSEGDSLSIVATDGHPQDPLTTDPVTVGTLPPAGLLADTVPLATDSGDHTITLVRGGLAVLDGSSGLGSIELSPDRDAGIQEGLEDVVSGLSQVVDVIAPSDPWDLLEGYALSGGSVLAWTGQWGCDDQGANCHPAAVEAHSISSDPLETGVAVNGWLYLVSGDGNGVTFHSLTEPTATTDETAGTLTIDWGCVSSATSVPVDDTAGFTALAAVPGPPGEIAVITDDPNGEIRFVNVSSPSAPVLAGSLDLPSSAAPTWASWDNGWLLLGREDGSTEVWRWDGTGADEIASWQSGATPVGANVVGGELWVGLADGRLQQVRLDGSAPQLVGETQLGNAILSMSAAGRSLVVVTDSDLLHVWMWELPPGLAPERVVWQETSGNDELLVDPDTLTLGQTCTVTWADGSSSQSSDAPPWTFFHFTPPSGAAPSPQKGRLSPTNAPNVQIVSAEGIPSDSYRPADWVAWESPDAATMSNADYWQPVARDCGRDRAALGSNWAAFASTGTAGIDYYAAAGPQGPASWQQLSTNGAVTSLIGLIGNGTTDALYACADDLETWDLGDPSAPAAQPALELLGAEPVAAAAILSPPSGGTELAAVGGSPLEVAVVDLGDPLNPSVLADQKELPGFTGSLERVAAASDSLYLLANDGGVQKLFRYSLSDPSQPSLEASADISGTEITALAGGFWSTSQDSGSSTALRVAVGRADGTIDLLDGATLTALDTINVPAVPRDLFTESEGDWCDLYVALGEGYGVAWVNLDSPDDSPRLWFVRGGVWRLIHSVNGWFTGMLTERGDILGNSSLGNGPEKGSAGEASQMNARGVRLQRASSARGAPRRERVARWLSRMQKSRERHGRTGRSQRTRGW